MFERPPLPGPATGNLLDQVRTAKTPKQTSWMQPTTRAQTWAPSMKRGASSILPSHRGLGQQPMMLATMGTQFPMMLAESWQDSLGAPQEVLNTKPFKISETSSVLHDLSAHNPSLPKSTDSPTLTYPISHSCCPQHLSLFFLFPNPGRPPPHADFRRSWPHPCIPEAGPRHMCKACDPKHGCGGDPWRT